MIPGVRPVKLLTILGCFSLWQVVASAAVDQATTTLRVNVAPGCKVTVLSQTPGTGGPPGQARTQTITFNYKVRTSASGQGQITLWLASANTFSNGSKIDYTTQITGPGTALSGTIATNAALNNGIPIVRFAGQTHSSLTGATGTVQFTLNPPPPSNFGPLTPSLTITCQ